MFVVCDKSEVMGLMLTEHYKASIWSMYMVHGISGTHIERYSVQINESLQLEETIRIGYNRVLRLHTVEAGADQGY